MTTPNMGLTEPTDHGSNSTWGALLNGTLDLIDAHDHTTGKGVKIPSAALNINADVSWSSAGTNYAITDVRALDFTQVASSTVTALADALYVDSNDSNLYFRNHTGTNVQITSGTTLNISIVGGIGGDYASISALLDYDDASDTYRFRQQVSSAVRQFAKISSADVNLFEYKAAGNATVPTNAVTLKSPSALAGSYSLTMPATLPATQKLLQTTSAGVMSASNVLANNENLQFQGTGYIQHGNWTNLIPFTPGGDWQVASGSPPAWKLAGSHPAVAIPASTTVYYPLAIGTDKDRIQSVTVYGRAFVGAGTLSLYLSSGMNSGTESLNVVTLSGGGTTLSVSADGLYNPRVLALQTPTLPTAGEMLFLRVDVAGGNTFDVMTYGITRDAP